MQISQEKYQCLFSEHNRIVYQYSRPGQGSKDMNLNFKFGRPNSMVLTFCYKWKIISLNLGYLLCCSEIGSAK